MKYDPATPIRNYNSKVVPVGPLRCTVRPCRRAARYPPSTRISIPLIKTASCRCGEPYCGGNLRGPLRDGTSRGKIVRLFAPGWHAAYP